MHKNQKSFDTLNEALEHLKSRGYTADLKLEHDKVVHENGDNEDAFHPEDFEIVEAYRFEGMSSTDDNDVVFAIEGKDNMKGVLVSAYGVYSEPLSENMLAKFKLHH